MYSSLFYRISKFFKLNLKKTSDPLWIWQNSCFSSQSQVAFQDSVTKTLGRGLNTETSCSIMILPRLARDCYGKNTIYLRSVMITFWETCDGHRLLVYNPWLRLWSHFVPISVATWSFCNLSYATTESHRVEIKHIPDCFSLKFIRKNFHIYLKIAWNKFWHPIEKQTLPFFPFFCISTYKHSISTISSQL